MPEAPFSQSQGGLLLGTSSNVFIDFAFSAPLVASSADLSISTLAGKEVQSSFIPTYLKENDIYSACQNLTEGNYKFTEEKNGDIIITTYIIPYLDEFLNSTVTLITYYHTITKILFYEIPKKFTTQPLLKESAAIAISIDNDGRIVGKGFIPSIYYSPTKKENIIIEFEITPVATLPINKPGITKNISDGVEATLIAKSYFE